jgi:hypothetical protein
MPRPVVWWKVALTVALILMPVTGAFIAVNWIPSLPANRETASGRILEMRKVVDGTVDSGFGGRILYGVEARVQYLADGRIQDRWLRASGDMSRDGLLLKMASHPGECLVYWPKGHPESARCWLK